MNGDEQIRYAIYLAQVASESVALDFDIGCKHTLGSRIAGLSGVAEELEAHALMTFSVKLLLLRMHVLILVLSAARSLLGDRRLFL